MPRSLSRPSKKPIIMMRKYWPGGSEGQSELVVIEVRASGFAEDVELALSKTFVEPLIEGMALVLLATRRRTTGPLSFAHLPGAHGH